MSDTPRTNAAIATKGPYKKEYFEKNMPVRFLAVCKLCEQLERELAAAQAKLYVCPDCRNTFMQPFKCTTCGAEKLYDATLRSTQEALAAAQSALSRFEQAALPTEPERLTLTRKLASGGVATETVVAAHHYDALRSRLARFEAAKMPEDKVCGEFTDFLNEPPQYEDKYMVREYRHQAYPKWMLVYEYIKTLRTLAAAQKARADDATTRATRAEATCRHYENALYTPGLKSTVVRNGNDAVEIKAERVVEIIERAHTIENETIKRCVHLCLLERDKADKMEPHDTPGSTMNLDHIMGQGWMANLLAKKLQALKKEG